MHLDQFDATLTPGAVIEARWTNSFHYIKGRAEVVKLSPKSMRVKLLEPVSVAGLGNWPAGHTIILPRPGSRTWSSNNCAAPLA